MEMIQKELAAHLALAQKMPAMAGDIARACELVADTLRAGGRVFFMGNGGSAADAQHLAAELTGRFRAERPAMAGLALTTDTSALTAIANDYGYDRVFVRQLSGLARPGDLAVGISTSGASPNVRLALEWARDNGLRTLGLLGKTGGAIRELCDCALVIPSDDTARIQEMHILVGHIICGWVEEERQDRI